MWDFIETFKTQLKLFFKCARFLGKDTHGNRYYESCGFLHTLKKKPRRWVIYKGKAEASKTCAQWHGWLHYWQKDPPTEQEKHAWQKGSLPNLTGTQLKNPFPEKPSEKTYKPWTP